jgi:hypothetical protein
MSVADMRETEAAMALLLKPDREEEELAKIARAEVESGSLG